MRLVNETTMTYDGLMEFNRQHQRKMFLTLTILLCVATGLMLTSVGLNFILFASGVGEPPEPSTIVAAIALLAIALFYILFPIIRRRKVCRKQAEMRASNTYIFTPEGFEEISYSNAAHIVDKRGFTEGSEYDFRMLLHTVIDSKKLHIK